MKILIRLVIGLLVIVGLLVVVSLFLPRLYRIERSIVIKARPEAVLAHVADLRAWKNWGAWQERDPAMKIDYSTPSTGPGAWSKWESKSEGNGKMTLVESTPAKLTYLLEFPDQGMKSNGEMTLDPETDVVRVTWSDSGDLGMNPVNRWFGVFLDKIIGPDFERGLSNLKRLAEK